MNAPTPRREQPSVPRATPPAPHSAARQTPPGPARTAPPVDPYDMRLDTTPDEPGYGHGV